MQVAQPTCILHTYIIAYNKSNAINTQTSPSHTIDAAVVVVIVVPSLYYIIIYIYIIHLQCYYGCRGSIGVDGCGGTEWSHPSLLMQQGPPPPVDVHGTFMLTIYYSINYVLTMYYALIGWYECLECGGTS
jgi:hypothetical protein